MNTELLQRQSRAVETTIGTLALLGSLPLLYLAGRAAWRVGQTGLAGMPAGVLPVWASALCAGLLLGSAGARLLSGRRRADGGLWPPAVLALGGLFFLAAPVFLLTRGEPAALAAGGLLLAGVAGLALAWRRWRLHC